MLNFEDFANIFWIYYSTTVYNSLSMQVSCQQLHQNTHARRKNFFPESVLTGLLVFNICFVSEIPKCEVVCS